jgi:hypothetical protein
VLFQYYDTGVNVYTKQEDNDYNILRLFEINKNDASVQIGITSDNIGYLRIGGNFVDLYVEQRFYMYLDGLSKYAIDFSFTENEIIFNNNSN